VALCAPSGPVDREAFSRGRAILAARYETVHDPGVLERKAYLAGSDRRRREELSAALSDPSCRAVFCVRGGYGVLRILEGLPTPPDRPIVGFSDVTVLHAWAYRLGVASVHGPNVGGVAKTPDEGAAIFALLESPEPPPPLVGLRAIAAGRAEGRLVGGNLTVLSHLCGTPYMPEPYGAILLLEDCNEPPYRIDRMVTQLHLAGFLAELSGVALGQFTECGDAEAVLEERLSGLGIPIVAGVPVGHGETNHPLPHGALARLDAEAGRIEFLEGAVS